MENKKTIIGIIILTVLIIGLIVTVYLYSDFNQKQMSILTQEANKIIESNLSKDNIDMKIRSKENYAKVENSIKQYTNKIKNIYDKTDKLISEINPNSIFSVQNMKNQNLEEVANIINNYKEKCQKNIEEYEGLITEEKIKEYIEQADFTIRKDYYTNLYNEVMLSDAMMEQYNKLEDEIKNKKGTLYEKLNKIEKIKVFLEDHKDSWQIKDDKIQFTNLNRMTEYYSLLNQVIG